MIKILLKKIQSYNQNNNLVIVVDNKDNKINTFSNESDDSNEIEHEFDIN